ncbi:AAA family ATPase [Aliivibrio finisterrensis]|uniref:AAA family ATPase n=1 Tax=Aliivibrio finisterrensis TaxID=511998 RepID=A0A4Q5KXX7_9GAMM|nr:MULTISPECIES: ExeA family protein [Aliivibrio]MDD9178242.1 AAA family ATPase [Aliivibrio sp. A6]RYU52643.1 AAA family ATPase [Aliivibrio finisterrensis]RYU55828.1 AAA family ATPase [Aliivibrio finisterrensis]RYU60668.1 AAA family ATPase [Aliivibrio finisterrensis]RYU66315.1 AAA family ATPase [Aliivibrio finisterrensis]
MYQDFFGFNELPFSMTPNARFLYLSERHKEALNYLLSGLGQGGGFALLTGEVGTGKTTVSRALFSQLDSNVHLALILNPMFSAQELLEAICDEFKISYSENAPLKQLTDRIVHFLKTERENGFQTIVAIDEAQHLGPDVLEQLRLLTNFETDSDKLLKVLLIGQPELQQKLQQANLRQLAQRITARYHLLPLTQKEIESYIKHRLSIAEGELSLFSASAIKTIVRRSNGIPRIVNLLCDKALWISYQKGTQRVDHQAVEEACKLVLDWQVETQSVAPTTPQLWFPSLIAIGVSLLLSIGSYRFLPQYLEANYPIVKPIIEKPLDGFSSQSSAFQTLLSVWGYSVTEFQANCTNAKRAQLYCVESNGTLTDLLALNRPALVWLQQTSGEGLLAILYRVNSKGAELLLPSKRIKVSHQWFEQHWNGAYTQLWKKPIITERAMKLGDQGDAILALNRLLSFALEQPINSSDLFSKETEQQVKEFQEIFDLKTDGIVGSSTQMWLDTIVNVDAPLLQGGE